MQKEIVHNVLGSELELCGKDPLTGFYRDGYCRMGPGDVGAHVVAPLVSLSATHHKVLEHVALEVLQGYSRLI